MRSWLHRPWIIGFVACVSIASSTAPIASRDAQANSQGIWSRGNAPPGGSFVAYDPNQNRMICIAGAFEIWTKPASAAQWSRLTTGGTPPIALYGYAAMLDPVRNRILVHGGGGPSNAHYSQLWELSLSTNTWTPKGNGPVRALHTLTYDPERDQALLIGGRTGLNSEGYPFYSDAIYRLSLSSLTWSVYSVSNPYETGHSVVLDPSRDRLLLYGGYPEPKTYSLDLTTPNSNLSNLGTTGGSTAGRSGHVAIYDPVRDAMVVQGGGVSDVWSLDLTSNVWSMATPSISPATNSGSGGGYDPVLDQMTVVSGSATWTFSLTMMPATTHVEVDRPSQRGECTLVRDAARNRLLMFGGSTTLNDSWEMNLGANPTWRRVNTSGTPPSPRSEHVAIYDSYHDRMVIFGGTNTQTWAMSGDGTWTQLFPSGSAPGEYRLSTAVYDPIRHRMLLFSGHDPVASVLSNDIWELTLDGPLVWTKLSPAGGRPHVRFNSRMLYDPMRDRVIIEGGDFGGSLYHDVWELPLSGGFAWHPMAMTGDIQTYEAMGATYDGTRDRVLLIGNSETWEWSCRAPELGEAVTGRSGVRQLEYQLGIRRLSRSSDRIRWQQWIRQSPAGRMDSFVR